MYTSLTLVWILAALAATPLARMMYSQIRLVQPKENCGVGKCRFAGKEHVHCTQRRCHFCADDDLIITNHAVVFHAGLAPPAHAEFFHIDSKCRSQQVEKPLNSSLLTTVCTECPLDGKKSHYHCIYCEKHFLRIEEHPAEACRRLQLYNATKGMCLRPFCKLKKKTLHFHCAVCDQGFSEKSKLRLHSLRHGTSATGQGASKRTFLCYTKVFKRLRCVENHAQKNAAENSSAVTVESSRKTLADYSSEKLSNGDDDCLPLDLSVPKLPAIKVSSTAPLTSTFTEKLPFTLRRITFSL